MNELVLCNHEDCILRCPDSQRKVKNTSYKNEKRNCDICCNLDFVKKDKNLLKNDFNNYVKKTVSSCACQDIYESESTDKENLLNKKLKELEYWDRELKEIKRKKKQTLKEKVKLHIELMKSNEGTKTLKELQKWKNQQLYEQLAILSRAQYIQDTVQKNLISNVAIHEDTIHLLLISLENLKKHIENIYRNKPMIKTDYDFLIL